MPIPPGGAKAEVLVPGSRTSKVNPSWSPDGKKIVFSEFNTATQQWELAIYNFDGKTVSYPREGLNALFPEWCPAKGSSTIVFQRAPRAGRGDYALWLVNADGSDLRRLFESEKYACIMPSWSPNGKHITYATVGKSPGRGDIWNEADDIWVISIDGKSNRQITFHESADWAPCFMPNGSRILFTSKRNSNTNIWSIPFRE
jgi:Tol biopolymer transport system component